jgi:hypothetical protein
MAYFDRQLLNLLVMPIECTLLTSDTRFRFSSVHPCIAGNEDGAELTSKQTSREPIKSPHAVRLDRQLLAKR